MKTELKKDVYKIIENGEHLNSLDATDRIVKLANDYCTEKMIEHINHIIDTYILDEKSDIAQAPIKPYLSTKPTDYIARKSSVLLGNAVKGKTSRIYYRSLDKGKELEF